MPSTASLKRSSRITSLKSKTHNSHYELMPICIFRVIYFLFLATCQYAT